MERIPPWLHFPLDIKLETTPLLEAWLEIRWELESTGIAELSRDPSFPYALGVFYKSIADEFPYREDLQISNVPAEMFPHRVRHRFRPDEDLWPLLQLGPGVATVNFTEPYSWDIFRARAMYLRNKLLDAYGDTMLETQLVALRYRNGVPFDCTAADPLEFFGQNLNTSIALPEHIPGPMGLPTWPADMSTRWVFNVLEPKSTGSLLFATGTRRLKAPNNDQVSTDSMLIWQLEIQSASDDAPDVNDEGDFAAWLTSAHAILHDWFFSLVEGRLAHQYKGGEDR